jgi:hypothetical protein
MSLYCDYYEDSLDNSNDDHEVIEKQNKKSKEILQEYEIIANEKRKSKIEDENELNSEIISKENEILKLSQKTYDDIDNDDEIDDIEDEIDELKNELKDLKYKLGKVRSRDVYPHGNGIFGFALLYHEISHKINVEWKYPIYTWTILGYKLVYPKYAIDYIQYKKDIEKSKILMSTIENKLRKNGVRVYDQNEDFWINEINSYLKENNITVEDDIVFRPQMNDISKSQVKDGVENYRITKSDLENYDNDYDDFDFLDYIALKDELDDNEEN